MRPAHPSPSSSLVAPATDRLARWAPDRTADGAADALAEWSAGVERDRRDRERLTGRLLADEATLADVLRDLAERGHPVQVVLRDGSDVTGAVVGVGDDVVAIRADAGTTFVARLACVAVCGRAPAGRIADGVQEVRASHRPPGFDTFDAVVRGCIADGRFVALGAGVHRISGLLVGEGADHLVIGGADAATRWVSLASLQLIEVW